MKKLKLVDLEQKLEQDYRLNNRKSWKSASSCLGHLREFFGPKKPEVYSSELVKSYQEARLSQGAERSSINREVSYLNRMMFLAFGSQAPRFSLLDGEKIREGVLEPDEFYKVISYLSDDLKDFLEFVWLSCWRVGKVRSLTWDRISLNSAVPGIRTEIGSGNKRTGAFLPLAGPDGEETELLNIIRRRAGARVEGCLLVFHRGGRPVIDFRKSWKSACLRAGLEGTIVHDLRRSGAVHLSNAGVPEKVIMARAGWKTRSTFDRYRIVPPEDMARANLLLERYLHREVEKGV